MVSTRPGRLRDWARGLIAERTTEWPISIGDPGRMGKLLDENRLMVLCTGCADLEVLVREDGGVFRPHDVIPALTAWEHRCREVR